MASVMPTLMPGQAFASSSNEAGVSERLENFHEEINSAREDQGQSRLDLPGLSQKTDTSENESAEVNKVSENKNNERMSREEIQRLRQEEREKTVDEIFKVGDVSDPGEHFNINHLTSLIMGFVAAGIIRSCSKYTMDMYLAGAGGLLHMYSEYQAHKAYEEFSDLKEVRYEARAISGFVENEAQRDALQELYENYAEVYKILSEKLKWQEYSATMFQSALTSALMQIAMEVMAKTMCKTVGTTLTTCPGPCQAQCAASVGAAAMCYARRLIPKPSEQDTADTNSCNTTVGACSPCQFLMTIQSYNNAICGGVPITQSSDYEKEALETFSLLGIDFSEESDKYLSSQSANNFTPSLEYVITRIVDTVFPTANASLADYFKSMVTGPGAGAAIGLLVLSQSQLQFLFGTPQRRAIAYGIMYAGVKQGISQTESDIEEVKERMDAIMKILTRFDDFGMDGGMDYAARPSARYDIQNPINMGSGSMNPQFTQVGSDFPCPNGKTRSGSCRAYSEALGSIDVPDGLDMGGALGNATNLGTSIVDDILGQRVSGETLRNGDRLVGLNNAIRDRGRRAISELEPEDQETMLRDLRGTRDRFLRDMDSGARDVFQKHGTSPSQLLSSLGFAAPPSRDMKEDDSEKASLLADDSENKKGVGSGGSEFGGEGQVGDIGFGFDDYDDSYYDDFDDKAARTPSELAGLGDDEEYEVNDISDRREASIFQIISVRYLRSGYSRLSGNQDVKDSLE